MATGDSITGRSDSTLEKPGVVLFFAFFSDDAVL